MALSNSPAVIPRAPASLQIVLSFGSLAHTRAVPGGAAGLQMVAVMRRFFAEVVDTPRLREHLPELRVGYAEF
jgi:hypothetical protein